VPKGPQGQKRPGDVIGTAVHPARIATAKIDHNKSNWPGKRVGGFAWASARENKLLSLQRCEIAKLAAEVSYK
jgi:hypothetical protein